MSILVNKNSKILVQGITGNSGSFHTKSCIEYGTNIIAGVTPGKEGQKFENKIPIYNDVYNAKNATDCNVTMIFVPAPFAADSIMEAADAGVELIIAITEGIPVIEMMKVKEFLKNKKSILIGPNCPGIITPDECKIGIMPGYIHKKGSVGVLSRSGTLTYEAVWQITNIGLGQSTCIGIGGDPIHGLTHLDVVKLFNDDPETESIVMIGEIGGDEEETAAEWIAQNCKKPVISFIAGATAPKGRRMGHAGAIIEGGHGDAKSKKDILKKAGVIVAETPTEIASLVKKSLEK